MAGKVKQIGPSPGPVPAKGATESTGNDERSNANAATAAGAFAAKAKDLGALREAVVDAAGVGAGLWLSYLFVFFYLGISVAAVTHRDLFLENPVKLPFLSNLELPLLGFFMLGPLLFLVLYAYVLLHFAMLADKVGVFDAELRAQVRDDDTRARLRRQLPSNIFVQYLAGPYEVRTGIMGFMLRLIALISLVLFPIALLVFFQLQFLPYHHAPITWWHRVAVLLGILILWMFWPSIARGQTTWISWRDFRRPKIMTLLLASLVPLLLVFTIATFPGEWLDSNLPSLRLVPTKAGQGKAPGEETAKGQLRWFRISLVHSMAWTSLHDLLFGGDVDLVARRPTSLWSNRLVLPGIDVIDHAKFDSEEKIEALRETLSLRGRHLEGAVLISSSLRKADFTAARLQGADLTDADLRGAKFECAGMGVEQDCTQLQGANLGFAQLQGAALFEAPLQGANLSGAKLQGADLRGAQLQGAELGEAQLQGANLESAQLQGAELGEAQLQGANLSGAKLQGADLRGAQLQGADLRGAQVQGAELTGAGAWLVKIDENFVNQSLPPLGLDNLDFSPLTADDKAELRDELQVRIADRKLLDELINLLDPILRKDPPKWEDEDRLSRYVSQAVEPPPDRLVQLLSGLACGDSQGRLAFNIVLRVKRYIGDASNRYAKPLAKALLDENCKGAKFLSDELRFLLYGDVSWLR